LYEFLLFDFEFWQLLLGGGLDVLLQEARPSQGDARVEFAICRRKVELSSLLLKHRTTRWFPDNKRF
jgi:hypothetical protein